MEAARADLFENGLFCVVPSPNANEDAVKLACENMKTYLDVAQSFNGKTEVLEF